MNFRTRTHLMLLSLAVAATTSVMATPQRAVATGAHNAPLTQAVPVDPRITVGTLAAYLRGLGRTLRLVAVEADDEEKSETDA